MRTGEQFPLNPEVNKKQKVIQIGWDLLRTYPYRKQLKTKWQVFRHTVG